MDALNLYLSAMATYLYEEWGEPNGERGRAYARQGRVLRFTRRAGGEAERIETWVKGKNRDPYLVDLVLTFKNERPLLTTACSCPVYADCKHCYAAALTFMAAAWRGIPLTDPPEPDMAEAIRKTSAALLGEAFQSAGVVRHALEQIQIDPHTGNRSKWNLRADAPEPDSFAFGAHEPAQFEPARFEALIQSWDNPVQLANAIDHLVRDLMLQSRESYHLHKLREELIAMESPFDALRAFPSLFLRESRKARVRTREWPPGFMEYLESEDFSQRAAAWLARHADSQIEAWIARQDPGARGEDHIRVRWKNAGQPPQIGTLYFEVLFSSTKLRDEPRHMLGIETILRDLQSGLRRLPEQQVALLQSIVHGGQLFPPHHAPHEFKLFSVGSALLWIALWGESGLLRWEDETIPRLLVNTARLRPCPAGAEGERIEWEILWPREPGQDPQGDPPQPIPLGEAWLFHDGEKTLNSTPHSRVRPAGREQARVYVRRGAHFARLEMGDMPLQMLALLRRTGSISRSALEDGRAAVLVERLGIARDPAQGGLVREVPAQPLIELHGDGPGRVRIIARAEGAGGKQFAWIEDDLWRQIEALPRATELETLAAAEPVTTLDPLSEDPAAARPLALRPRPQDVEPAQLWLRRVIPLGERALNDESGLPSFAWALDRHELSRLYHLIRERPAGLRVLASAELARRLRPASLRLPRVSVQSGGSADAWLTVQIAWEPEIEALNDADVRAALASTGGDLVELPGGRTYLRSEVDGYLAQRESLERAGLTGAGPQRLHALQAATLEQGLLELIGAEGDEPGSFATRVRELVRDFRGIPAARVPKATDTWLRPYQRLGVDFLVWAARSIGGALLADDMGLGKTLQLLAALAALRVGEKNPGPALIICPASVVQNWRREAERFVPGLRICVLERGPQRHAQLAQLDQYDLVIKNFTLARIEIERLRSYEWFAICVDEAQAIKNPAAATTVALKSLNARYRFALTGTPVENRVTDLWSIVEFVVPGWLGPLRDLERHVNGASAAVVRDGLRARLRPIMLRRLKGEVAPELPPRIEERLDCEMPAAQRKAYLAEVKVTRELLGGLEGRQAGQGRIRMLAALTRLRQLCCDPGLLGIEHVGSGKIEELLRLLPDLIAAGHKVLIFSQFVRMLERLRPQVAAVCPDLWMLTGKTRGSRQMVIDSFEQHVGPAVFMISLKAGGTGLNLISASHVILFDPWWNPAVEAQAIDRTHRIGQTQSVVALRLITKGTIEERITELQERKKALMQTLVGDEAFAQTLSREDFAFLLDEKAPNAAK